MADEVARLKVAVEGATQAISQLKALDDLVSKLDKNTVHINVADLERATRAAKEAAESTSKQINNQVTLQSTALAVQETQIAVQESQANIQKERLKFLDDEIKAQKDVGNQVKKTAAAQEQINGLIAAAGTQFFRKIVENVKDAVEELKAMNREVVAIQKVTGATKAEMDRMKEGAFTVSGNLGTTPSDYLASVTQWARAGYKGLADELGQLSAKTQVVGDVTQETANKFLLAVDAAYKLNGNAESLGHVLDGVNEISNNYATSVEKVANGMGIVSSLAHQAKMSVEETAAAIGTITAVTQEGGASAARALRALILNIQGSTEIEIDTETGERWTEDEIQRTAAALGELNIQTKEYINGVKQLRNPMEVIAELSEKYNAGLVTEAQLQEVVASLGGKVRSNQLMALIQQRDMYNSMIETFKNSAGSADQELEYYLNGWEAKVNKRKALWTQFVESFNTSELSMGLLDVENALLGIANTPTGQIMAVAGAITALNVASKAYAQTEKGRAASAVINQLKDGFTNIVANAVSETQKYGGVLKGLPAITAGAVGGFKALGSAIYNALGPAGIAVVSFMALSAILDKLIVTTEEHWENARDLAEQYNTLTGEIEALEAQLKNVQDRMRELNAQDSLTLTEQGELARLEQTNEALRIQIRLKEEAAKLAAQSALEEAKSAFTGGYVDGQKLANKAGLSLGKGWGEDLNQVQSALAMWEETYRRAVQGADAQNAAYAQGKVEALKKLLSDMGQQISEDASLVQGLELPEALELSGQMLGVMERISIAIDPYQYALDSIERFQNEADPESLGRYNEALAQMGRDGQATAEELERLAGEFPFLRELMDKSGLTAEQLAEHFTTLANQTEETAEKVEGYAAAIKETASAVSETISTYTSRLSELEKAQKEIGETGVLSLDTAAAMMGKYGDEVDRVLVLFTSGLADEQQVLAALNNAYTENVDQYKDAVMEKMADSEEYFSALQSGNREVFDELYQTYGDDLREYTTLNQMKAALEERFTEEANKAIQEGNREKEGLYSEDAQAFAKYQDQILTVAADTVLKISRDYAGLGRMAGGFMSGVLNSVKGVIPPDVAGFVSSQMEQTMKDLEAQAKNDIVLPNLSKGSAQKGAASRQTKSYYEQRLEDMKDLVSSTQRSNELMERYEEDSGRKRIQNLREVQDKLLEERRIFRNRGLSETAEEVQELQLMYHDLGDEIKGIYAAMGDDLLKVHKDIQRQFDFDDKNLALQGRPLDEVVAENEKRVAAYRKMQEEVHQLAEYYRSQGVRAEDALLQELGDAWVDYQHKIESVYDNLTDYFNRYIDESTHKIEELARTTGTVGEQLELYTKRIAEAYKTIAALQAGNVNGANNSSIRDMQNQIWKDQDAIRDLQEGLWVELEDAFDGIFEGVQEDIDEIQDQIDGVNDTIASLDKQLEAALEPVNRRMDELNAQLEKEREHLEKLTKPLQEMIDARNGQIKELQKQIDGYYTLNGTLPGEYVEGLDDQLDKLREELDKVNTAWEEEKAREEEALALQKKQLAVEEAQKDLEAAQLALETARNERNVYTLKDGVWAWRADEKAVADAEQAVKDAEKAKEEAEKDLQDFKEEQAHKQIVKRLEEQIKALEKQKELINRQIDLLQKQNDAVQGQIDTYRKESEARQEHIELLIQQTERQKEAWEQHYERLKKEQKEQLELLEEQKKAAEKQYDQWMDTWKDIRDSIEEPSRDIADILNDIARYGTPAMAGQIDRVTDLLDKLGVSLEGFDPGHGGGFDPGDYEPGKPDVPLYDGMTRREVIDQMLENGMRYANSRDPDEREYLMNENQRLGALIGAIYNSANGTWDIFDYSSGHAKPRPGVYEEDWVPGYAKGTDSAKPGLAVVGEDGPKLVNFKGGEQVIPKKKSRNIFDEGVLQEEGTTLYSINPVEWKKFMEETIPKNLQEYAEQVKERQAMGFLTDDEFYPEQSPLYRAQRILEPYFPVGETTNNYDQSVTINGMKVDNRVMAKPLSEVVALFALNENN